VSEDEWSMSNPARLLWAMGGEARVLSVSADTIVLESSVPSPPGSRIDGVLMGGSQRTLRVKIHASRKQPSGVFRLEGRPIDFTKEAREELLAMVRTE